MTVLDEWKMALVTVLVEVERVKMVAVGHPQLNKMLAVLTLMQATVVAVLWQSLQQAVLWLSV